MFRSLSKKYAICVAEFCWFEIEPLSPFWKTWLDIASTGPLPSCPLSQKKFVNGIFVAKSVGVRHILA